MIGLGISIRGGTRKASRAFEDLLFGREGYWPRGHVPAAFTPGAIFRVPAPGLWAGEAEIATFTPTQLFRADNRGIWAADPSPAPFTPAQIFRALGAGHWAAINGA